MPSQHVPRTCSQEEKLLFRPCLTDKKATFRGIEVFVKGRTVDLENDIMVSSCKDFISLQDVL